MKTIKYAVFSIAILISYSCSDSPSGPDEIAVNPSEGTLNVSGDVQEEHKGVSQYVGLKSEDGDFLNLALHVTEVPLGSTEEGDFSFVIRMVGAEGPFSLETGEYELGGNDNLSLIASYTNRTISDNTVTYSASPNSSGTVTIVSVGSENIEAVFDLTLHIINGDGSVRITGELNAECLTAGVGC